MPGSLILGLVAFAAFALGLALGEVHQRSNARRDPLCPICLGPVDDDGLSEAFGED